VRAAADSPRLPSLRVLVTVIVVLPIAIVAAALVTISIMTTRTVAEQLGEELIADATGRVVAEVGRYLGEAVRVSDLYTRRIETGKLPPTNLADWEQAMFDDLATSPNVASICFGSPAGDATYLQRAHNRLEFGIADGSRDCAAIEWPAVLSGKIDREKPIRNYRYDARTRPWYTAALKGGGPRWTPVYFWFGEGGSDSETGTGFTRPIRSGKKLIGVLTIDVTLSAISDFLRRQPFVLTGSIFIIDNQGMLVAASDGRVNSLAGARLPLAGSDSATARAIAPLFPTTQPAQATEEFSARSTIAGKPVRVSQVWLHPSPGADWRVITVLPESAFLTQARNMQKRSILFALIAVAMSVVLGLVFSRRLSQPIMQLTQHAARIGGGDLNTQLALGGARELHQLAQETNRMAHGLRQRLELEKSMQLATHVQQSLLPQQCPSFNGLDIAAHSRYCESTGGDYYDFVTDQPDRAMLAIGDVVGHGVGSALVMATARAALRTCAADPQLSPGQLMARVNNVLSLDPHGLFMTMALLVIERKEHRVRWASAGHDPVISYNPADDAFTQLEGGDIPLGVIGGSPYQEFSRNGLAIGSVLFAGTDGLWEARRSDGEMYGKERLRDVIRQQAGRCSEDIAKAIEQSLADFMGGAPVRDDITFVVIKVVDDELTAAPPDA
jgi:sigma-B regulation protein RsbU (phosphoserine phosphatase)